MPCVLGPLTSTAAHWPTTMCSIGTAGLRETLTTLQGLNIKVTGAGHNEQDAKAPAALNLAKARLLMI